MAKKTHWVTIEVSTNVPPPSRAGALWSGVMRHCKVPTYADLERAHEDGDTEILDRYDHILVTDEDWALMERFPLVARYITGKAPYTSIATCTSCHNWIVIAGASPPRACPSTPSCEGELVKGPSPTIRQADPPDDI